jgi:ERF superfamily
MTENKENKLVVRVPAGSAVIAPNGNGNLALLQTIERLATDKAVFDDHMALMQGELKIIDRKGRIEIRAKDAKGDRAGPVQQSTKYALYEDVVEKVLPIMSAHGFSISHVYDTEDKVRVTSILSGYGHERTTKLTLMHDSTGSKNSVQAVVSSISYAKRVNLCALLSIATRGEDDDGAGAGKPITHDGDFISEDQRAAIVQFATDIGCEAQRLYKHLRIESIDTLPANRFEEAMQALKSLDAYNKKQRARSQ